MCVAEISAAAQGDVPVTATVSLGFVANVKNATLADAEPLTSGAAFRKNGKLLVNLVNTAGPHADRGQPVFDEIPAVGPLTVSVRMPRPPSRVTVEPGGAIPEQALKDGCLTVRIPALAIHEAIVVE